MSHARQQIRDAAAALLRAATKWQAVFATRLPSSRAVMPYLMVFDDAETAESIAQSDPDITLRQMNIIIAGRLRLPGNNDTESVEDAMDDVAAEIETTLTFAALQVDLAQLQSLRLTGTEKLVVTNDDAVPQYAEITLNYVATYATQEGIPATLM